MQDEKEFLITHLLEYLSNRKNSIEQELREIVISRNNESKSSAGDKYETGRERIQQEKDKLEGTLNNLKTQIAVVDKIKKQKTGKHLVNLGSLIKTNKGKFFISIGLGKVKANEQTYFVVSPRSPAGQILINMSVAESKPFQGNELTVIDIL